MAEKSKILIIGGTGYIGKHILDASAKSGHPTFALVRESTISDPAKAKILEGFKNSGVTILTGDLDDHESMVRAIKQVDVVISAVGLFQLSLQDKIIAAIKEAGNVKRFFPSEFGNDVDRTRSIEPARSIMEAKVKVRRHIEADGIPYTYVVCDYFAGYSIATLLQHGASAPPRDKLVVLGDGNIKAVFNVEQDIATYTIKTVDDPRTLNKTLYINPPKNIYTFNELVALWEKKIGKTLEKEYVPEEQILKQIQAISILSREEEDEEFENKNLLIFVLLGAGGGRPIFLVAPAILVVNSLLAVARKCVLSNAFKSAAAAAARRWLAATAAGLVREEDEDGWECFIYIVIFLLLFFLEK